MATSHSFLMPSPGCRRYEFVRRVRTSQLIHRFKSGWAHLNAWPLLQRYNFHTFCPLDACASDGLERPGRVVEVDPDAAERHLGRLVAHYRRDCLDRDPFLPTSRPLDAAWTAMEDDPSSCNKSYQSKDCSLHIA